MSGSKNLEELAFSTYWDARYAKPGAEDSFEWFKSFENLQPFLQRHLPTPQGDSGKTPSILHLGCGNSNLPLDLLAHGYTDQTCVDFSTVVIDQMSARHVSQAPSISWHVVDVRYMTGFQDGGFDVALDKGTLDAMISGSLWDPPEEVRTNTRLYIDEVARVLKPGGTFLYITYRQPHFVKPAITRDHVWTLNAESLVDPDGGGGFEYFGYAMRKYTDSEQSSPQT